MKVVGRFCLDVLGIPIDVIDWDAAIMRINSWALVHESRSVCICNAHSLVTSRSDAAFRRAVAAADMATPDGAPVAWMLRRLGASGQGRINGPDLMWRYCEQAATQGVTVYLYGSSERTLGLLRKKLGMAFPDLSVVGSYSPPYRPLSKEEDEEVVKKINASGAGVVWISLGCPKQEKWMAAHCGRVNAVMVGVGAAFDYHAGTLRRAPLWMQNYGLEWLYRLVCEPRRLWRRYLVTNTLFVFYAAKQLCVERRRGRDAR